MVITLDQSFLSVFQKASETYHQAALAATSFPLYHRGHLESAAHHIHIEHKDCPRSAVHDNDTLGANALFRAEPFRA